MAGDLDITERVVWSQLPTAQAAQAAGAQAAYSVAATTTTTPTGGTTQAGERIIHQYGRLGVAAKLGSSTSDTATGAAAAPIASAPAPPDITEVERLGLAALNLRDSAAYREAKANRPRGEPWDMPGCCSVAAAASPEAAQARAAARAAVRAAGAQAAAPAAEPTSSFLEGSVAVGIIMVSGPGDLEITKADQIKVLAEVQNGLDFLANQNPVGMISFSYDIWNVALTKPADPNLPAHQKEAYFRDPAMGILGYTQGWSGVVDYVNAIRTKLNTRWAYCAFFTKYPLFHFGYATLGGPYLVMQCFNNTWEQDSIDRIFAHETGHIFGAPDEYASSGCDCGGSWGRFGTANSNCENCATGGGVKCLMKYGDWELCYYSRLHFGWQPRLMLADMGYEQNWRIEQHPRYVLDITGDKRADIVGFGPTGVVVSLAQADGKYSPPVQVLNGFGSDAGGWRVDKHLRLLADTTGDGLPDIVGFGGRTVQVARNLGGGRFADGAAVLTDMCDEQGWRVESHPRFAVDINGNGRADLVGFKDIGVFVSLAQTDGSYAAPRLVLQNYGTVQGWTVLDHPRFLADTTGSGRLDIVGFGGRGVLVSRQQADGTFSEQVLVLSAFCYDQGWRGNQHPRFVVDITGDGRADIVGFGPSGVVVSLAQNDGTYSAPVQVLNNFGYDAVGWRVEYHPRFLADTTGDGLPDIVGFGNSGVQVSRNLGGGKFAEPVMVFQEFALQQGWLVDKHPRFLADTNGDGKADIVGFGYSGVQLALF